MFPETVTEYLEEQAEELAGKPAALERFITEHLVISLLDNAHPITKVVGCIIQNRFVLIFQSEMYFDFTNFLLLPVGSQL